MRTATVRPVTSTPPLRSSDTATVCLEPTSMKSTLGDALPKSLSKDSNELRDSRGATKSLKFRWGRAGQLMETSLFLL